MPGFPLPSELKLLLLSLATNDKEVRRNETLKSLSLIHSSWRELSQALLAREVQIWNEEQVEAAVEGLRQTPFRHIKTHKLHFRGDLELLLAGKGRRRWMELESLQFAPSKGEIDLDKFSSLKNLRTLHLSDGLVLPIPASISFLHLSRLILGKNLLPAKTLHASLPLPFPRTAFPALRDLSLVEFRPLCRIDHLLSELLPVVSSLSIFEPHSSSIERILARLENCQHLALKCRNDDLQQLLLPKYVSDSRFRLELESLHLESTEEGVEAFFVETKMDRRELQAGGIEVKRIVLYGSREGEGIQGTGNERLEWRRGRLCVEEFDGR